MWEGGRQALLQVQTGSAVCELSESASIYAAQRLSRLSHSLSLSVTRCNPSSPCLPPSLSCALSSFHLQQSESFKVRAALSNAKKSSAEAKKGNGKGKGRERSIGSALGRGMGLANTGYPSRVSTVFTV